MQMSRVGVEAGRVFGVDIADAGLVVAVGGQAYGPVDVGFGKVAALQAVQNLFGCLPQVDAESVDEFKATIGAELGMKRQFGIGRSKADERAARVVADATDDGGTDARRAEDRMWLAAQRSEQTFELIERASSMADDLAAATNQVDPVEFEGTDDYDIAVVTAARRRTSRKARVSGLHDDDAIC